MTTDFVAFTKENAIYEGFFPQLDEDGFFRVYTYEGVSTMGVKVEGDTVTLEYENGETEVFDTATQADEIQMMINRHPIP